MISSCSSFDVVAIQSSNWSFVVVFWVASLFFVCFFVGDVVLFPFSLRFGVFVVLAVAAAEVVGEALGRLGAVVSFLLSNLPVGNPINDETADLNESSFVLFFSVFFGGECFLAFLLVTS